MVTNCGQNPESMVDHLEGYWQISTVKKDGKMVKEFTINTNIDYFKVQEDLSGFRKKVSPTLDGKFTVSQHQTPFLLKIVDGSLQIHYSDKGVNYFETIIKADPETLVIKNDAGFIYTYNPFKSLDLNL